MIGENPLRVLPDKYIITLKISAIGIGNQLREK